MRRRTAIVTAMALVAAGAVASDVAAAPRAASSGRSNALVPAGSTALGALSPRTELDADVELRPRDPAALARFATDVATPGSPDYGHFLARGAFADRFGPTTTALAVVRRWLAADGLSVISLSTNHLTLAVRGEAVSFERGFSTAIEQYRLVGGRLAYATTSTPTAPTRVGRYLDGVVGLDDAVGGIHSASLPVAHTVSPAADAGPTACTAAAQAAKSKHVYTANQLADAYGLNGLYGTGDEGAGVTIGMFELGPNLASDIDGYQSCFGTHASVSYVKVDGGAGTGAGDGEAALDIETALGVAPKASYVVYQAPRSSTGIIDDFTTMIDADTAKVISTSWGQCESKSTSSELTAEATLFQQAAAQGQSVFAASGDYGTSDCATSALAVDDPASQPFVTGVGGTTLSAIGPPPSESAWNDSSIRTGAGGGGVSSLHAMPSYQSDAPTSLHVVGAGSSGTPCHEPAGSYCREVPDVSADADRSTGYLIYFDGGWSPNGGTSASSPLWAGLMALVDASSTCGGRGIGFANPALYDAAATSYASDFHDVTSGDNDYTPYGNTDGLYRAGVGYDMATGLGTPIGTSLAATLCSLRTTVAEPSTTSLHETRRTLVFGSERDELFRVVVTGHLGDGLPLGRYRVFDRTTKLCSGALTRRTSTSEIGSCRLTVKELAAGRYADVYATYVPAAVSSSDTRIRYTVSTSKPPEVLTVSAAP